jgi:hypothetical protein
VGLRGTFLIIWRNSRDQRHVRTIAMTHSFPSRSSGTYSFLEKALSSGLGVFSNPLKMWRHPRNSIRELDLAAIQAALDKELLRLENENRQMAAVQAPIQATTGQVLLFSRKPRSTIA